MLDAHIRTKIDPGLKICAQFLIRLGIRANHLTLGGFAVGITGAVFLSLGFLLPALFCFSFNRISDGLDGSIARVNKVSDLGAYLDIVCDFIFYSAFAFAFQFLDFPANSPASSFLIFSFIGTSCSFLTYSIFAEKRKFKAKKKSFVHLGGLTEGFETIVFFILMMLFPEYFRTGAYIYGAMCWLTTVGRISSAIIDFKDNPSK